MAYVKKHARDTGKKVLTLLADAGGSIVESFLDPYGRLRLSNMFVAHGKVDRTRMRRVLKSLEKQELVTIKEKKGEITVTLTKNGSEKALKYQVEDMQIPKPDWWDRKWRLVMFDIPEARKSSRNAFKAVLDNLGFIQLQHSVYVHPYECHNEIEFVRNVYEIKPFVKLLVVEKLEGEGTLRTDFDL